MKVDVLTKTVCTITLDAPGVENKINSNSGKIVTNRRTVSIAENGTYRLLFFVGLHFKPDCAELVGFIGCICIETVT